MSGVYGNVYADIFNLIWLMFSKLDHPVQPKLGKTTKCETSTLQIWVYLVVEGHKIKQKNGPVWGLRGHLMLKKSEEIPGKSINYSLMFSRFKVSLCYDHISLEGKQWYKYEVWPLQVNTNLIARYSRCVSQVGASHNSVI